MKIKLFIKPLTYNQYYRNTKSGHRVKTGAGLAYDEELDVIMEDYAEALALFGRELDLSNSILRFSLDHYNENFYLQDNSRLSMTAGDVDGPIKVIQDKVFKLMGQDDYLVKSLRSDQYPANKDYIEINLAILDLSAPEYLPVWKD